MITLRTTLGNTFRFIIHVDAAPHIFLKNVEHVFQFIQVHRRLLNDDALGVDEALNEYEFDQPVVARGQFLLTFGNPDYSAATQRNLMNRKLLSPTVFVGQTTDDLKDLQEYINFEVRMHNTPLCTCSSSDLLFLLVFRYS